MDRYRIQDIQKATLNGRKVKLFKAFELAKDEQAYIFCGQFSAPQRTPNNRLTEYIASDFGDEMNEQEQYN